MQKLDDWVIDHTQNVYLWLLDRTGIYAGTVMFLAMAASVILEGAPIWQIIFLGIFGALAAYKYYLQDKKLLTVYNAMADFERNYRVIRAIGIFITLFNVICSVLDQDLWKGCGEAMFVIWWYMLPVKIRDREPPEKRFWQPAPQLGS